MKKGLNTHATSVDSDQPAQSSQADLCQNRFRFWYIFYMSKDNALSHNNPCFPCIIAITIFLVSHTCEIRLNDVVGQGTLHN